MPSTSIASSTASPSPPSEPGYKTYKTYKIYKTYNYNRSFQAAQGAGAGLPPLMAVNGVGSVLFEVGHQFHPFADGLLVDGNQVVVTFGERFLQTAYNGLYGYVGTHCQQRAEKNHVVGF